jgi:hypothetical protein
VRFTEAREQLQRAAREAPGAVEDARQEVGAGAASTVASRWPVDTRQSAAGWGWDGKAVINDVRHTPFVHKGLAGRLVPEVLEDAAPEFANLVEERLDRAAGWK